MCTPAQKRRGCIGIKSDHQKALDPRNDRGNRGMKAFSENLTRGGGLAEGAIQTAALCLVFHQSVKKEPAEGGEEGVWGGGVGEKKEFRRDWTDTSGGDMILKTVFFLLRNKEGG